MQRAELVDLFLVFTAYFHILAARCGFLFLGELVCYQPSYLQARDISWHLPYDAALCKFGYVRLLRCWLSVRGGQSNN